MLVNVAGPASATTDIWIGRVTAETWAVVNPEITYVCEPGQANALWVRVESDWFRSPEGEIVRFEDEGVAIEVTCDGESRQATVDVMLDYDYGEGPKDSNIRDGDGWELGAHYNIGQRVEITAAFANLPPDAEDLSRLEILHATTTTRTVALA